MSVFLSHLFQDLWSYGTATLQTCDSTDYDELLCVQINLQYLKYPYNAHGELFLQNNFFLFLIIWPQFASNIILFVTRCFHWLLELTVLKPPPALSTNSKYLEDNYRSNILISVHRSLRGRGKSHREYKNESLETTPHTHPKQPLRDWTTYSHFSAPS